MLGEAFFATGHELAKARSFGGVVSLLATELCAQIGAEDVVVFEVDDEFTVLNVHGKGPVAARLKPAPASANVWIAERVKRVAPDGFDSSCSPTGAEVADVPGLAAWLKSIGGTDILGGTLIRGKFRSACAAAIRKSGRFTNEERERFQAAMLLTRCVCGRICNDAYELRVLERLLNTRKETTNAVFIVSNGIVAPYNPGAVAYSEACWPKDEVDFKLSDASSWELYSKLKASWTSPVNPNWVEVELDLGCGQQATGALARPDGHVLLFFSPPPRQAGSTGTVPMLTRRQCDIMDWIAEGKTSAEVAMILEISPRTVEKHLEAVFQRFGVENRVAAVRSYLEAKGGLIPGQGA